MDFITRLPACATGCNAICTCVDCLTKYTVLTAYASGAGALSAKQVAHFFFRVLSDSLAYLAMWSMIETHILLQSSGLNFGTPLDLVPSLVVLTIPKLMVKWIGNTERWNRPLDVCWLSNLYLKQSGVSYYVLLSLPSTQQLLRALGAYHLSLCMVNRLDYLLMLLWEIRVGCLLLLTLYSSSSSLSRMPNIISSEPRSTRSATLTSTTVCRNIKWEKKCCSLRRHFTWQVIRSLGLGLLDLSGYWSGLGRQPTDWISGGDSKISIMSSTFLSFERTPLEAYLKVHLSLSK